MKTKIYYLIGVLFMMIMSSCEKVIDLELEDSEPRLIIESSIYENDDSTNVLLSYSTSYFNADNTPAYINNAVVTINDGTNDVVLTHLGQGKYYSTSMNGVIGKTYTLTIDVDGVVYEAASTMLPPVLLAAVNGVPVESGFGEEPLEGEQEIQIAFQDPPGENNYYRVNIFLYDPFISDWERVEVSGFYALFDDKFSNGNFIEANVESEGFFAGDSIRVELESLDEATYDFFVSFEEVSEQTTDAIAPYNPISNVSNDAIGVFGAISLDQKEYKFK